ncbi:hypothetical protein NDU88_008212 [Pleurodeles waltl]|uniref:Uncharacterized protein n=1 Tax=Pleurodeles waltl TaxID=8319 RepID=A0AAV7QN33_PLEWA|nr:hypothetical protein NDU88_008212 [Pleurodeles waltl]
MVRRRAGWCYCVSQVYCVLHIGLHSRPERRFLLVFYNRAVNRPVWFSGMGGGAAAVSKPLLLAQVTAGPGREFRASCVRWGAPAGHPEPKPPAGERARPQPQAAGGRPRPVRAPGHSPHTAGARPHRGTGPVRRPRAEETVPGGPPRAQPPDRGQPPPATRPPVRRPPDRGAARLEDVACESRV